MRWFLAVLVSGCASAPWVPHASPEPVEVTLVWVGQGECERFIDGAWVRAPEFDYDFSVEQRRHPTHWESVKSLRRRHAQYDGAAGDRLQTWFFHLALGPGAPVQVTSSLGNGSGTADAEFRSATLELQATVSAMAPFDRYRIVQHYNYEQGSLDEVVSLDKGTTPWIRNHEHALLFAKTRFDGPPIRRAQ